MRVVIAGGHGQIALRLTELLSAQGDEVVGLVRNPDHEADIVAVGGQCVVQDLERSDPAAVAEVLAGADAAVFSAGAGPGSGAARKDTVDRAAAVLFAEASAAAGVRRHLQVSAMGLDRADDPGTEPVFAAYLAAKRDAEHDLKALDLDWTILRPGRLTNDPGTGLVRLAESVPGGPISRADVAAVIAALLPAEASIGRTLELIAGETAIDDAVGALR